MIKAKSKKMIIGLVVAASIFTYYGFKSIKKTKSNITSNNSSNDTLDQTIPDSAIGFGYKNMWIAVKTNDQNKIAELLHLKNIKECNWEFGINKAYEDAIFITPAIDGWTLACGYSLSIGQSTISINELKTLLESLSMEFGEAQYFCTHRGVDYHCWMQASKGKVNRVYSYLGEQGENIVIEGVATEFEKKFNLVNTLSEEAKEENYFDNTDLFYPDESFVMQIANEWSINPSELDARKDLPLALGLVGFK